MQTHAASVIEALAKPNEPHEFLSHPVATIRHSPYYQRLPIYEYVAASAVLDASTHLTRRLAHIGVQDFHETQQVAAFQVLLRACASIPETDETLDRDLVASMSRVHALHSDAVSRAYLLARPVRYFESIRTIPKIEQKTTMTALLSEIPAESSAHLADHLATFARHMIRAVADENQWFVADALISRAQGVPVMQKPLFEASLLTALQNMTDVDGRAMALHDFARERPSILTAAEIVEPNQRLFQFHSIVNAAAKLSIERRVDVLTLLAKIPVRYFAHESEAVVQTMLIQAAETIPERTFPELESRLAKNIAELQLTTSRHLVRNIYAVARPAEYFKRLQSADPTMQKVFVHRLLAHIRTLPEAKRIPALTSFAMHAPSRLSGHLRDRTCLDLIDAAGGLRTSDFSELHAALEAYSTSLTRTTVRAAARAALDARRSTR